MPPPAYGWGPYWGWDDDDDFGVGLGVGLVAGAVVGAAASSDDGSTTTVVTTQPLPVGSIVTTLPGGCTAIIVANASYQRCGPTWYKPQYVGTTIEYIVVVPPQ